jgi:hypothetical protein
MSKKNLTVALVAAALAGTALFTGCGSKDPDTDATPNAAVTTSGDPTPSAPTTPETPADIELGAGSAGPVKVGMSKAEVTAIGVFDADVASGVDGCPVHALVWKKKFGDTLDVQALKDGSVASIGVRKPGPKTASGLQIGSSYADVLAANPGAKAVEAGYGQTGILVHDTATDGWIGYLFDAELKDVKDTDTVSFIEITQGKAPGLMRDGC